MSRGLSAGVAGLTLAVSSIAQQTPTASAGSLAASPFVQVEHLVGDQYAGFTQSCLLVYSDGRYHRESRRQEHRDNRPKGDWQLPEVFEGAIGEGDLQQLKGIVESENFRKIIGTFGDPDALRSHLLFGPIGVTPHADVDILEASVAHSNGPQVFEVLGPRGREPGNSLKLFNRWVAAVEKRKGGRIANNAANSCALPSSFPKASSWQPTTRLIPQPFYTPGPDYPLEERNAKHLGTVTVHAMINSDGSVGPVSVRRGINPTLDRCALDAVKKWKFVPARLEGIAIARPIEVHIRFQPD